MQLTLFDTIREGAIISFPITRKDRTHRDVGTVRSIEKNLASIYSHGTGRYFVVPISELRIIN